MRRVLWDKAAVNNFEKAINYIRKKSLQNAEKVRQDIHAKVDSLIHAPEKYPIDKYKNNNLGNYRVFELHRLRVTYLIKPDSITISRIRHTSMEPENY